MMTMKKESLIFYLLLTVFLPMSLCNNSFAFGRGFKNYFKNFSSKKKYTQSKRTLSSVAQNEVKELPCGNNHTDIRLDQIGYSMEKVKTRVQYYDICYAHTAVDMVDAFRFSNGDQNTQLRTSPLFAAVASSFHNKSHFYSKNDPLFFEWGYICDGVNAIIDEGICDFKKLDKLFFQNVIEKEDGPIRVNSSKLHNFFQEMHFLYRGLKSPKENIFSSNKARRKQESDKLMCFIKGYGQGQLASDFSLNNLNSSELVKEKNYVKFLYQFTNNFCGKRNKVKKNLGCETIKHRSWNENKILKTIHAELDKDQKALPLGLDFCQRLLTRGKTGNFLKGCDRHALTIIGRRNNGDKCELLLKNTFPCSTLHSSFECEEKTGKVWVNQKYVLKSMFGLNSLNY